MKKNSIILTVAALIVSLLFTVTGCGLSAGSAGNTQASSKSSSASKLEKIKKAGKIVVGTSADYPPYEFHKAVNGKDEIVGFDIMIAQEIAKDLGVKLEIKDMKFDGLLAALDSGNVDMVIAGMNPTEERKKNVDFSVVYYTSIQSVIVRTEDKDTLKTIESLKGKKVGAQKGSTQETIAKEQMPNSELKALGKVTDLMLELKNKKVDALVVEQPVAVSYANKNKDVVVSDIKVANADKGSAIAIKKGNEDFVQEINKTLDKLMKADSINKFVTSANEMVE